MRKLIGIIGVALCLGMLFATWEAYFVTSHDPQTNRLIDGLGRELSVSPWLVRFIFDSNRLWPGPAWFFGDIVLFWTIMLTGWKLASWGLEDTGVSQTKPPKPVGC